MTDYLTSPMYINTHPPGWIMNARTIHEPAGRTVYLPEHKTIVLPCRCIVCIRGEYPELYVGPAVPTVYESSTKFIEKHGLVGLYKKVDPVQSTPSNPERTLIKLASSLQRIDDDEEWVKYLCVLNDIELLVSDS